MFLPVEGPGRSAPRLFIRWPVFSSALPRARLQELATAITSSPCTGGSRSTFRLKLALVVLPEIDWSYKPVWQALSLK